MSWESPALHRVQPSSPALSLAWVGAGRSWLARALGPGVQGRYHADAGCHPHRRRSTVRKEVEDHGDPLGETTGQCDVMSHLHTLVNDRCLCCTDEEIRAKEMPLWGFTCVQDLRLWSRGPPITVLASLSLRSLKRGPGWPSLPIAHLTLKYMFVLPSCSSFLYLMSRFLPTKVR